MGFYTPLSSGGQCCVCVCRHSVIEAFSVVVYLAYVPTSATRRRNQLFLVWNLLPVVLEYGYDNIIDYGW